VAGNVGPLKLVLAGLTVLGFAIPARSGSFDVDPLLGLTGVTVLEHVLVASFAVSGFLAARSLHRRADSLAFAAGRVLRLVPAFLVATLMMFLVVVPLLSGVPLLALLADHEAMEPFGRLLFLQDGTTPLPHLFAHTPAGSLALIAAPLVPALLAMAAMTLVLTQIDGRHRFLVALGVAGAFALAAATLAPLAHEGPGTLREAALFSAAAAYLFGFAAFGLRARVTLDWRVVTAATIIAASLAGWAAYLAVLPFAVTTAAMWLAFIVRPLGTAFFGDVDLSYGMVLYAWPLMQFFVANQPFAATWIIVVMTLVAAAGAAVLSWRLVERPAIRFGRRLIADQTSRPASADQALSTRP
jgi:peptidoglycan/LPS O-acetylase OafA/YrhL